MKVIKLQTVGIVTKLSEHSAYTEQQGSYKKLQPFFKDFSRTTLDFQLRTTYSGK